jgi:hypothetical protein
MIHDGSGTAGVEQYGLGSASGAGSFHVEGCVGAGRYPGTAMHNGAGRATGYGMGYMRSSSGAFGRGDGDGEGVG